MCELVPVVHVSLCDMMSTRREQGSTQLSHSPQGGKGDDQEDLWESNWGFA